MIRVSALSMFAGVAMLSGVAAASATEPMTLTSTDLDKVTAGFFDDSAIVNITQVAVALNLAGGFQIAKAAAANYAAVAIDQ